MEDKSLWSFAHSKAPSRYSAKGISKDQDHQNTALRWAFYHACDKYHDRFDMDPPAHMYEMLWKHTEL